MSKKRILWVGEGASLSTGYGVYLRELFSRLYSTNKYELFSLDAYTEEDDHRRHDFPWVQYSNMPSKNNQMEQEKYRGKHSNQWGEWRLEEVLLDCRPDCILSMRDFWVDQFIMNSPLRPYFNWIFMPALDAIPQSAEWVNMMCDTDALLAYCSFGEEAIKKYCGGNVSFAGIASPAADYSIFKPVKNKRKHKEKIGIDENSLIVGFVSRNQRRKLFPDLIKAFEQFCLENPDLSKNIYLYLHTALLDIGWDIGKLIRESLVGHKILLTYMCSRCGKIFPSFYHDSVQSCIHCGAFAARTPNTDHGCTTEQLSDIMNCFDLYVQYATNGAFEMTIAEAASCGVPVMCVNYSCMESHVKNINAIPIEVERFYVEPESYFKKAYPNNDDLAKKLRWFFELPEQRRRQLGRETYEKCREHYSYDKAALTWMNAIDSLPPRNNWNSPAQIIEPNLDIPNIPSNYDFVRWCVANVWGDLRAVDSYYTLRMSQDLHDGQVPGNYSVFYNDMSQGNSYMNFTKDNVVQECILMNKKRNYWEKRRVGLLQEETPDFILKAKR